jgi:UDP-N-acetylmuramoyl-L-alanyl-D-glutamate--2,6-diaminopimelate ligase
VKQLKEILYKVAIESIIGTTEGLVSEIAIDSRKVVKDALFVAISGTQIDGHQFIDKAIGLGAKYIICERLPENIQQELIYIHVEDTKEALGSIAANFYDNPSEELNLIGITGTNGKTTVATLLYELFESKNQPSGLISTVAIKFGKENITATHTTPNSITTNKCLSEMVKLGVKNCFMEVSSHGIDQKRISGLEFKGAIFTNLTHDHLDYHDTFKNYRDTKKKLFDQLPKSAFALVNIDDKNGGVVLQNCKAKRYTYALHQNADFKTQVLESQFSGMLLKINQSEVWTQLLGEFNAYNLLAVFATAKLLKLEELSTLRGISVLENVPGRFQTYQAPNQVMVIVDYAHTPDALENVLVTINKIRTRNENLYTVVGCGGHRDQDKRPKMGATAAKLSSKVIFTSDNPRDENPEEIIKQIEAGVDPVDYKKTMSITQRKEAIKVACQLSTPGDIILIAGKGHENYQEIKGDRLPFDDYEVAKEMFLKIL